jgi:CheY-like chemotaxis protein
MIFWSDPMTTPTEFALTPYFHPTTITFLDDNESFLQSLDLELPGTWACRPFPDPLIALEFLSRPEDFPPLMDRCFSIHREDRSQAVIHLDLDLIEQEISHVQRFHRNSVVVVDYAMPSMNGLEFCAALADPHIRKAMLTGVADEKIAVEAFNAGLIHRFIPKQTMDPVEPVRNSVTELLHDYFNQYTAPLKTTLAIDPPGFLMDPEIARYVERLMEREDLVEYYLVNDPHGLMMLKANGEIWRVAILDDGEMQAQAEQARAFGAPAAIQTKMDAGAAIAFLSGLSPADHFGDEAFPWQEQVQNAKKLVGERGEWTIATWRRAPAPIDFDPGIASYDAYLTSL